MAGGGKSSSSSNQTTNNADKRVVADSGAVGVSGNANTINVLDGGAINSAFAFAGANDQQTGKNLASELGFASDVFTQGLTVLDKAGQQIQAQTGLLSQAYDNAKGTGDQKTILYAAAIAAVAIVAIKVLK